MSILVGNVAALGEALFVSEYSSFSGQFLRGEIEGKLGEPIFSQFLPPGNISPLWKVKGVWTRKKYASSFLVSFNRPNSLLDWCSAGGNRGRQGLGS